MIDIYNKVFDTVYNAVIAVSPNADVMDVPAEQMAKYPAVTVRETNNVPVTQMNTDDNSENFTRVSYEIRIYSDLQTGSKDEAVTIFQAVDDAMKGMKFYRSMTRRLPNQDRTVFCMYGRYEAIVGKPMVQNAGTPEETIVYQMYRRT